MDSDQRVSKLLEWLTKSAIKVDLANQRPWGSYNPSVSFDGGKTIAVMGKTFGWGYAPHHALAIALEEAIINNDQPILNWLGNDRTTEIKALWIETEATGSVQKYLPDPQN